MPTQMRPDSDYLIEYDRMSDYTKADSYQRAIDALYRRNDTRDHTRVDLIPITDRASVPHNIS